MSDVLDQMMRTQVQAQPIEGWLDSAFKKEFGCSCLFDAMPLAVKGGAQMKVSVLMIGDSQTLTLEQLVAESSKEQIMFEQECLDVLRRIDAGELEFFDFQRGSVKMLFSDGTKIVAHGHGEARWLASCMRADGEPGFFCLDPGMTIQKAA